MRPLHQQRQPSEELRADGAELRAVDEAVGRRPAAELLAELDALEANVARVTVPLSYADELYSLRSHINLVRRRLQPR